MIFEDDSKRSDINMNKIMGKQKQIIRGQGNIIFENDKKSVNYRLHIKRCKNAE